MTMTVNFVESHIVSFEAIRHLHEIEICTRVDVDGWTLSAMPAEANYLGRLTSRRDVHGS